MLVSAARGRRKGVGRIGAWEATSAGGVACGAIAEGAAVIV